MSLYNELHSTCMHSPSCEWPYRSTIWMKLFIPGSPNPNPYNAQSWHIPGAGYFLDWPKLIWVLWQPPLWSLPCHSVRVSEFMQQHMHMDEVINATMHIHARKPYLLHLVSGFNSVCLGILERRWRRWGHWLNPENGIQTKVLGDSSCHMKRHMTIACITKVSCYQDTDHIDDKAEGIG